MPVAVPRVAAPAAAGKGSHDSKLHGPRRCLLAVLLSAGVLGGCLPSAFRRRCAFVAWRPEEARPSRYVVVEASSYKASKEGDISGKLDAVLREKLGGADKDEAESEVLLSESAQKAVAAATGTSFKSKADVTRRKKKKAKDPSKSREIVKTLDEVLRSTNDDSDRSSYLAPRRDIYKEVGISEAEVEAYWQRREETASNLFDKFAAPGYVAAFVVAIWVGNSVYDSIANPNTEPVLASLTGTG